VTGVAESRAAHAPARTRAEVDFSVIFFSDAGRYPTGNRYQLVFDIAEYVDRRNFSALWVPERHFHRFGGIYSNPGVLAAALAMRTRNVRLRAGSVVLPLHHPALVAETWAMVDNLSGGRVDLAFASGWNPNDFLVSPDTFAKHKQVWRDRIPVVQELWRQRHVTFLNGAGDAVDIQTFPPPVQAEPNVWLTATRQAETFEHAGHKGYNVLTMLMGSSLDELGEKIALYRRAREQSGFDPESGVISLMLHTFVHPDGEFVRQQVRDPFHEYISSAISSHAQAAGKDRRQPTREEMDRLAELSFERYSRTAALIGTPQEAMASVRRFVSAGVNEVACLCDFGAAPAAILQSLPHLDAVRRSFVVDEVVEPKEPAPIVVTPPPHAPLTVVQRQHAFLARLDPAGSIAHNDLAGFDLEGELDVDRLRACLQACGRRHDALRIVFDEDGQHQRFLDRVPELVYAEHSLSGRGCRGRLAGVACRGGARTRSDLSDPSLLRVHVPPRPPSIASR
jgi:natural product biosynthesis luciferase-like monooxygenase protein